MLGIRLKLCALFQRALLRPTIGAVCGFIPRRDAADGFRSYSIIRSLRYCVTGAGVTTLITETGRGLTHTRLP